MEGAISTLWAPLRRIYMLREKSEKPYQFPAWYPHSLLRHKLNNYKQLLLLKIQKVVYSLICMIYISRRENVNTGCPRRNVPYFGRVFLILKYTDITQNTYVQS
jgi:hypothetical protein